MLPEIGSIWKAKDGRIMRVEAVIIPVRDEDMPWAKLTVLNPEKGMRRKTAINTGAFGHLPPAFLCPMEED
jgi:hypothetical protein